MTETTMMTNALKALSIILLAAAVTACGFTAPKSSEGYADLDSLGMFDTDIVMTLSFGPAVLNIASAFVDEDPEIKQLMRDLDGVRIRIYEVDGDATKVAARMSGMSDNLVEDGWEPVMVIREEDEQVHMLIRTVNQQIKGLTVLVMEDNEEAVIVNVMGDIRPEQFSDVMVALDTDVSGVEDIQVASASES